MAFMPSGVAALPSPKRLARKLRVMDDMDGWSAGIPLKGAR
jgi:hypothetical protein